VAVRLDLKFAILRSGRTQREIAETTRIPEVKLSNIVRGLVLPNSMERMALASALGEDYFSRDAVSNGAEARSRR
jgi:hypothetical protein